MAFQRPMQGISSAAGCTCCVSKQYDHRPIFTCCPKHNCIHRFWTRKLLSLLSKIRSRRAFSYKLKIEGPQSKVLDEVATYSVSYVLTFAFFKISGFIPISEDALHTIIQNVFAPHSGGYSTIHENRRNNITCRTWAFKVLTSLQDAGHIPDRYSLSEIESIIKQKSILIENSAASGAFGAAEVIAL